MFVKTPSEVQTAILEQSNALVQSKKSSARTDKTTFRIDIELSQSDEEECRRELQHALRALTGHHVFEMLLSYVMSLEARAYKSEQLPQDCLKWDQKGWSHLCKVTRTALQEDGGNWYYGICIILMAGACTRIPANWRLQEYCDVRNVDTNFVEDAGDVLKAMGGLVTWQSTRGRSFCTTQGIPEEVAKEFMSLISVYVQKVSILLGPRSRDEALESVVNYMRASLDGFSFSLTSNVVLEMSPRSAQDKKKRHLEADEEKMQDNKEGNDEAGNACKQICSASSDSSLGDTWFLDPALMDATVALSRTFDGLRKCEEWTEELETFWDNLQRFTTAHPLMSSQMHLPAARREAQAGVDSASALWRQLTSEAQMRLNHLQKVANEILDQHERRVSGSFRVDKQWPSTINCYLRSAAVMLVGR